MYSNEDPANQPALSQHCTHQFSISRWFLIDDVQRLFRTLEVVKENRASQSNLYLDEGTRQESKETFIRKLFEKNNISYRFVSVIWRCKVASATGIFFILIQKISRNRVGSPTMSLGPSV